MTFCGWWSRKVAHGCMWSSDAYGYLWLTFTDEDFEDLVGVIHIAGQELGEKATVSRCWPPSSVSQAPRFKRRTI